MKKLALLIVIALFCTILSAGYMFDGRVIFSKHATAKDSLYYIIIEKAGNVLDTVAEIDTTGTVTWYYSFGIITFDGDTIVIRDGTLVDSILFFDDGTNAILEFDNPFMMKGNYVRIGDAGTVTYADGDGDLYVEDELEVDGAGYFTGATNYPLTVEYNHNGITGLTVNNTTAGSGSQGRIQIQSSGGVNVSFTVYSPNHSFTELAGRACFMTTNDADCKGLSFVSRSGSGNIKFYTTGYTAGDLRMTIDSIGNVGVNTATPTAKLDVAGDIVSSVSDTVASATTITLGNYNNFVITGTADIDSIDTAGTMPNWAIAYLQFTGTAGANGIVDGKNLKIAGNGVYTPNDILTLQRRGNIFYEISRSVN